MILSFLSYAYLLIVYFLCFRDYPDLLSIFSSGPVMFLESTLYILDTIPLLDPWLANIFPQFVSCFCCFFLASSLCDMWKFPGQGLNPCHSSVNAGSLTTRHLGTLSCFYFDEVLLTNFFWGGIDCIFGVISKTLYLMPCQKRFFPSDLVED